MVARARMRHGLTVEPQLGSAGAALGIVLFICLGVLLTVDHLLSLWPWVVATIVARMLGKAVALAVLARPSALGWQQAGPLVPALQPISSLAALLAGDTFAWPSPSPPLER